MKARLRAQQSWPALPNTLLTAAGTAVSRSASSKTMLGDFPPSSSETRVMLGAACCRMLTPVSVSPVKAILSTPGWPASALPVVAPGPVMTLSTPLGRPASSTIRPSSSAVIGV